MTETTIALTLPIRRVVLGNSAVPPPAWLRTQHQRLVHNSPSKNESSRAAKSAAVQSLEEQLAEQLAALDRATGQLHVAAKTMQVHWQQVVVPDIQRTAIELAHAIASKLVMDRVLSDQFPIENLVREVIERLNTEQPIVVKLHPADLVVWQERVVSQAAISFGDRVQVQADASLKRGDCQASSGEVSIVYELRRQIEELRQQLIS